MDLVSRLKDFYGFASGLYGGIARKEHFDATAIFGNATQLLPQELDVEGLVNPLGLGTGTDAALSKWAMPELSSMQLSTPLGFIGAIENGLVSLRQAEKALQDPAQSALVKQGVRELSQFHANAMLGWETANALRQG